MLHVMIDIETLDTKPESVVASIGIVTFDRETVHKTCLIKPSLNDQYIIGRSMDINTIRWWMGQSDAARHEAFNGETTELGSAMAEMTIFFQDLPKETLVWANGPQFDLTILRSLYEDFSGLEISAPWSFRNERCLRTLREAAGIPHDYRPKGDFGPSHSAVSDCLWQIAVVQEAWRRLDSKS